MSKGITLVGQSQALTVSLNTIVSQFRILKGVPRLVYKPTTLSDATSLRLKGEITKAEYVYYVGQYKLGKLPE